MRRILIITALAIAGLTPLVRYHPQASSVPPPLAVAAPPSPGNGVTPSQPRTIDGPVVDTEFGPYQVRVTFSGTMITDVRIITKPGDRQSQRIAGRAEPRLRTEALQAQNAHIDTVSGATVTSEAYAQSLQAAIDANGG